MINFSPATRIFVALAPVDMRQGFNGLCNRVRGVLGQDPFQGHLYVFSNRRRDRVKILYFDGSGLWVCARRLEANVFSWPKGEDLTVGFSSAELAALLSGLEVQSKAGLRAHHYLGYGGPVGQNLQYTVRTSEGRLLTVAVFGAAAWKCAPRDQWIGWSAHECEGSGSLYLTQTSHHTAVRPQPTSSRSLEASRPGPSSTAP